MRHLKKLNPNTSKHELKEGCDDQDVADGADRHEHTLNHVLEGKTPEAHTQQELLTDCPCGA